MARTTLRIFVVAAALLLATGCDNARRRPSSGYDAGVQPELDGAVESDLGVEPPDLGEIPQDLGVPPTDLGPQDLGPRDLGPPDLGPRDLGPPDLGPRDLGPPDLGPRDLGPPDLGPRDLGPPDLGSPDLGGPAPVAVGALIVTELIANPAAVSDTNGEWFEVYNTTARPIDLFGLTFRDEGTNSFTVDASVIVPAAGWAVLGRNADTSTNGGVSLDYVYPGSSFYIDNTGDEILIERAGVLIDRVAYGVPTDGAAYNLDPRYYDAASNDALSSWCDATSTYGLGDRGTPGAPNSYCF